MNNVAQVGWWSGLARCGLLAVLIHAACDVESNEPAPLDEPELSSECTADPRAPLLPDGAVPCPDHPQCGWPTSRCSCNVEGLLIFDEWVDESGRATRRTVFNYNANGDPVLQEFYGCQEHRVLTRTIYAYDERGNPLMEWTDAYADAIISRGDVYYAYSYDESGHRLSRELHSYQGTETHTRYEYAYDDAGRLVLEERDHHRADGVVDTRIHYSYDLQGRLALREYDEAPVDGVMDGRTVYRWDPSGLLETVEAYDVDGIIDMRRENRYDASGGLYESNTISLPNPYLYRRFFDPPCHLPRNECRATSREEVRPEGSSDDQQGVEE